VELVVEKVALINTIFDCKFFNVVQVGVSFVYIKLCTLWFLAQQKKMVWVVVELAIGAEA
jgi:hypothetical protein